MNPFRVLCSVLATVLAAIGLTTTALAQENKLRIITWADYAPAEVVAQFKKETGIDVEVTLSNNEEMISKLRATGGAGFDLAQPSQDRIVGPQQEFGIYKPMDMSKIKTEQFIPSMLDATKKNTTLDGKVYGLPHIWGTDGLVVNTKTAAKVGDYPDLCAADYKGKTSVRLKRPTLLGVFLIWDFLLSLAVYSWASEKFAWLRSAPPRLAPLRKALLRSAPMRLAPMRLAPVKSGRIPWCSCLHRLRPLRPPCRR